MAAAKGTVAALRPSPALTVPENITVSEASQLCAAKRTDCVLVVDDEEGLSGIFTAKDMAYRVCFPNICLPIFFKKIHARSLLMVSIRTQLQFTR
jgi:predicted transcriptional regulator